MNRKDGQMTVRIEFNLLILDRKTEITETDLKKVGFLDLQNN